MSAQIGDRIKSARVLAGLSLRKLSECLDGLVSHNAISKYERGLMVPDGKVLNALSRVLDVKTDYFLRPHHVEITKIEFRKKHKLGKKKVNAIQETIKDHLERYIELEDFLNLNNSFSNPIGHILISSVEDVEDAADLLLKRWNIGVNPIPNVVELLEDKEVKVVEIDADHPFDGLSGWVNGDIPAVVINKNFTIERKRFTALHELGHLMLNFAANLSPQVIEKSCHRFAGAILLPEASLYSALGKNRNSISLNELILIKESFGISIQAIMARAKDAGIISQDRFVHFRKWINADIKRKKEEGFGAYPGTEQSNRFKQLIFRAAAEEIITLSKAASLSNVRLAEFREEYMEI